MFFLAHFGSFKLKKKINLKPDSDWPCFQHQNDMLNVALGKEEGIFVVVKEHHAKISVFSRDPCHI